MNVRAVGMALGDAMTARCDFVCVCVSKRVIRDATSST